MNGSRILIIGANGYIGRHLTMLLCHPGIDLTACDIHPCSKLPPESTGRYRQLDITEPEATSEADVDVDYIFLMAGLTGTKKTFNEYADFITVNEIGLLNILSRMRETGSRARLVFPSSRLVYKGMKGQKLVEGSEKDFKSIYAVNKYAAERYLEMYRQYFGIHYSIFRVCVPYGNSLDRYSYGTIGFFLEKARKGENIVLFGDGSLMRTFTHVDDICRIIVEAAALESTLDDVFNIGGEAMSLVQAASQIAEKFGVSVEFSEWPPLDSAIESGDTIFDSGKLDRLLAYRFRHRFSDWTASLT